MTGDKRKKSSRYKVGFYLDMDLVEKFDATIAASTGVAEAERMRSQFVRVAMRQWIERQEKRLQSR